MAGQQQTAKGLGWVRPTDQGRGRKGIQRPILLKTERLPIIRDLFCLEMKGSRKRQIPHLSPHF